MTPPRLLPRPTILAFIALLAPLSGTAGTLFSSRMESAPLDTPSAFIVTASAGVQASARLAPEGTIDTYRGERSPALVLDADFRQATAEASARISTPTLTVSNSEQNLGLLTLGFDLHISLLRPVRVLLTSLDAKDLPTGVIATTVFPPVAGAYYRFTPDLSAFAPVTGKFDPRADRVRIAFELADPLTATPLPREPLTLKIDNLAYTAPSFYVDHKGSDRDPGTSPREAFASLQKAISAAAPGDTVVILEGTYTSAPGADLVQIAKKGAPDRWITLRSHPDQKSVLTGDGWNVVSLDHTSAYIELRGLTVRGNRQKLKLEDAMADPDSGKYPDSRFNTNGLATDSRKGTESDGKAHHIRFIRNSVGDMPGGGISAIAGDHITIEGNHLFDNCHLMRYAGSGISVFRAWDYDTDRGYKMFVLNNVAHGNRCYVPWTAIGKISDGNGIIIDDFINYQKGASKIPYEGRTLVQNNLAYNNGGSGVHAYAANHVDIVNNTAYYNAQSPELTWSQIFAGGRCNDVRVVNNIMYAQRGKPLDLSVPKQPRGIVYSNNIYFGDGDNRVRTGGGLGTEESVAAAQDQGNRQADPRFLNPSVDPATADFRLARESAAIDAATSESPFGPLTDLDGRPRPQGARPDAGAFEYGPGR